MKHTSRHPFRRAPLGIGLAAVVLLLPTLAACGGDETSNTSSESERRESAEATTTSTTTTTPTTTTEARTSAADTAAIRSIATGIVREMGVTQDQADCAAGALVAELGADRALEIDRSSSAFENLSDAEKASAENAFNDCIPGSAVAETVMTEFYSSVGTDMTPDDAAIACAAAQLEGEVGTVAFEGLEATGPDSELPTTVAVISRCVPSAVLVDVMADAFVSAGMPAADAACAAQRLEPELNVEMLIEMGTSGPTPEWEQKATAAVTACTTGG